MEYGITFLLQEIKKGLVIMRLIALKEIMELSSKIELLYMNHLEQQQVKIVAIFMNLIVLQANGKHIHHKC